MHHFSSGSQQFLLRSSSVWHLGWLQSLDFYLPEYNIAIECQGIQHFEEVQYFGGEKGLKENKKRDKKKYDLCKEHGVVIFYVNYKEKIKEKIKELFINNAVQL